MINRLDILASGIVVIFVTVFMCSSAAQNNQLPNVPCPNVFFYSRSGNKNFGIIQVGNIRYGETTVAIKLSQQGLINENNPGQLSLNFNKDKVFEYIEAGRIFTFRVDFPVENIIPRVTSITVNGIQICSGPKDNSPSTSTMSLEYTLSAYKSTSTPLEQPQAGNDVRLHSWPNFKQAPDPGLRSDLPNFLKYSPSFSQQNALSRQSLSHPTFNRFPAQSQPQSFNYHTFNHQPSYDRQPFFNQPTFNQPQLFNPPTFDSPTRNQHTYNFPSFSKPAPNPQIITQPSNNQPNSLFVPNPQNPYLNNANGIESYRPAGEYGQRNPPPIFPTPTPMPPTEPPTTKAPAATKTIFTAPTTGPTFDIDPRNPEVSSNTPSTDRATFEYINSVCGRENVNFAVKKLNVKGSPVSRSRFPWIVAVFTKIEGNLKFRCGGSLISTRTVVSAAHCFYLGFEELKAEQIVISMGRHNLTDTSNAHNIDVERIINHPDYNPTLINFDADLAIVRLTQSITFTTAIRPICMWQGPIDAREIEGVSGAIVGWGADDKKNTTTVPTLVNATVVSEITCIRSNDQFYSLTSNRTLCAGNLDGSGPCMGDSGNGFMIRSRNKWMLRGTVSATIGTPTRPCMLDQYAIYSDIAMFIEWIRRNMLL